MSGLLPPEKLQVLLVEDNPADARLMSEAFRGLDVDCELHVAEDGVEALAYLTQHGKYREAARPDLILLDLNLPKLNGHEVLEQVKSDGTLREIPVVVLTTSTRDEDLEKSYNLHANCFISKPRELPDFTRLVESLQEFWFHRAVLPTR